MDRGGVKRIRDFAVHRDGTWLRWQHCPVQRRSLIVHHPRSRLFALSGCLPHIRCECHGKQCGFRQDSNFRCHYGSDAGHRVRRARYADGDDGGCAKGQRGD